MHKRILKEISESQQNLLPWYGQQESN